MAGRPRIDVLGCGVDPVDMDDAIERIESFVSDGRAAHVVTFGAEMAVRASRDPSYRAIINGAELVERLCDAIRVPVFFLGGAE